MRKKTIDEATPIGELMICTKGILASKVGAVHEGTVVFKGDARVAAVPEAFRPLVERLSLDVQ